MRRIFFSCKSIAKNLLRFKTHWNRLNLPNLAYWLTINLHFFTWFGKFRVELNFELRIFFDWPKIERAYVHLGKLVVSIKYSCQVYIGDDNESQTSQWIILTFKFQLNSQKPNKKVDIILRLHFINLEGETLHKIKYINRLKDTKLHSTTL